MSEIILIPNAKIARQNKDNNFTEINRFGSDTSYAEFGLDGTMTLYGDARVIDKVRILSFGLPKGVSAPTDTIRAIGGSGNMYRAVTQFSKTSQQDLYMEFHAPTTIDDSVNVQFQMMWMAGAAWTSGNYVWKVEYLVKNESSDMATGTPTTISMDVTPSDNHSMIETTFTDTIDINNGQVLFIHFYRDVANDNADDTGDLNMFHISFTKNKQGS